MTTILDDEKLRGDHCWRCPPPEELQKADISQSWIPLTAVSFPSAGAARGVGGLKKWGGRTAASTGKLQSAVKPPLRLTVDGRGTPPRWQGTIVMRRKPLKSESAVSVPDVAVGGAVAVPAAAVVAAVDGGEQRDADGAQENAVQGGRHHHRQLPLHDKG